MGHRGKKYNFHSTYNMLVIHTKKYNLYIFYGKYFFTFLYQIAILILYYRTLGKDIMSFNSDIIDIYVNNITSGGNRISTWVWLAAKHKVSKVTLSRVSSIRKFSTDKEFSIFLDCMRSEDTVMLSNGTSSHNIDHIAVLLREGNKIVGKGKIATTTNVRSNRSCVYVLHSDGYYKIGVTLDSSVSNRVKQLQIGNPYIIELVGKTGTIPNAYEVEKELQTKFKDNRVRGEWFTLNSKELEYILKKIGKI